MSFNLLDVLAYFRWTNLIHNHGRQHSLLSYVHVIIVVCSNPVSSDQYPCEKSIKCVQQIRDDEEELRELEYSPMMKKANEAQDTHTRLGLFIIFPQLEIGCHSQTLKQTSSAPQP